MTYKIGDRVLATATVISTNLAYGYIGVEFDGGGTGAIDDPGKAVTGMTRPKTPGQRAYEAWEEGSNSYVAWDFLDATTRARWNRAAEAAGTS